MCGRGSWLMTAVSAIFLSRGLRDHHDRPKISSPPPEPVRDRAPGATGGALTSREGATPADAHPGSASRRARDLPASACRADDRVGNREAQPRAALARRRAMESIEDSRSLRLGNAGPIVV